MHLSQVNSHMSSGMIVFGRAPSELLVYSANLQSMEEMP